MHLQALFTRDPAAITDVQVLMAMVALRGIYEKMSPVAESWRRLQHRRIELLLPTYGERSGLKGKICKYWVVNPLPTMIPAIEAGWVESVFCLRRRGRHGALHRRALGRLLHRPRRQLPFEPRHGPTRRPLRHRHVHWRVAADRHQRQFLDGLEEPHHRLRRRAQHGLPADRPPPSDEGLAESRCRGKSRPRLLARPQARRPDRRDLPGRPRADLRRGARRGGAQHPQGPAWRDAGDDLRRRRHAYRDRGRHRQPRRLPVDRRAPGCIRAVAGYTPVGLKRTKRETADLRARGIVQMPEDVGVRPSEASRSLLATQDIKGLVRWSKGLYDPPSQFVDW